MSTSVRLTLCVLAVLSVSTVALCNDIDKTGPELITSTSGAPLTNAHAHGSSKGFPLEIHFVTTPDDYILQMFRIPSKNASAPVVLLQHGLLDSADTWILNSADESLAFILHTAGYDVWLGNSRGNKYSRNSTHGVPVWPFDGEFWEFTWDEMAKYDVPTQIDFALRVTGKEKLIFIGHSQGTTQMFANLASTENVKDKVALFVALAPVAWLDHSPSLLLQALARLDVDKLVQFLGVHEFLPTSKFLRWLLPEVCDVTPLLCESAIYLFAGLDLGDLNTTRMDVYTQHFPSGTSVNDMVHWAQLVRWADFSMYSYGVIENEIKYHQISPPNYDVGAISAPVALFYGGKDDLADPADVKHLISQLPSAALVYQKYYDQYAHLDFVWGEHAAQTMYTPDLLPLMAKYAS